MAPRYRCIRVEEHGGRPVFVVEHRDTGERTRIWHPRGRWVAFTHDQPVRSRAMVAAARRYEVILRGEAEASRTLFPTSRRSVRAEPQIEGAAALTSPAP